MCTFDLPSLQSSKACSSDTFLWSTFFTPLWLSPFISGLLLEPPRKCLSLQPLHPTVQAAVKPQLHRRWLSGHFSCLRLDKVWMRSKNPTKKTGVSSSFTWPPCLPSLSILTSCACLLPQYHTHFYVLSSWDLFSTSHVFSFRSKLKDQFKVDFKIDCLGSSSPFSALCISKNHRASYIWSLNIFMHTFFYAC